MNPTLRFVLTFLLSAMLGVGGMVYTVSKDFATKAELTESRAEMHEALKPDHEVITQTGRDVKEINERLDRLNREVGEIHALLEAKRH